MPYGTPSKDAKRPAVKIPSDQWDKFKVQDKNPTRGDGPLSKANTMGDQGYKEKG